MPYTLRSFPRNVFNNVDFSELERYKRAWAKFEEVYAIQVLAREDVSTDGIYNINLPYQYSSFEERMIVLLGQQLHLKAYPPSSTETENWNLL